MLVSLSVLSFIIVFVSEEVMASCPTIIGRSGWGAQSPKSVTRLPTNPPPYVVIHHAETPACLTTDSCKQRVRSIQNYHMNSIGWADIGYNFLIGGDGNVYEGRGWGIQGAHSPNHNSRSMGICLIGNFQNTAPPSAQLDALNKLIQCGVENNRIASDYHLVGHRQVRATTCPGNALYEIVKRMPHWEPNPN